MSELETGESQAVEAKEQVETAAQPNEAVQGEETAAPTAGASEAGHEQQPQEPEWFVKKIHKQTAKQKAAEERAEAAEKRARELEAKYESQQNKAQELPPMPDEFAEDFSAQIEARERVIAHNARIEAEAGANQRQESARQQELQAKQQQTFNETVEVFAENGQKAGLTIEVMTNNRETIQNLGVPNEVVGDLFSFDDGPQLMDYLAKNPEAAVELAGKSPVQAGMMIATIRAKAKPAEKKLTAAPAPAEILGSSQMAMPEGENPANKLATFK